MSAADCKAAKRKMMKRYGNNKQRSVADAIAAERRASARAANYHSKPKKIKQ